MIQMLIIADDFTGALDTSVQLVPYGVFPRVITDMSVDFELDREVLVVDAETRHLSAKDAYDRVKKIVEKAEKRNIPYIYKKTDSAIRGNIGAELTAVLDASKSEQIAFIPAFPQMNRCTKKGIHYINDVPVAESVFGADPFEPVGHSKVSDIIHEQSNANTCDVSLDTFKKDVDGIYIFDSENEKDLNIIGKLLLDNNLMHVTAGCAGFATILPELIGWKKKECTKLPQLDTRLLIICGSVNPITGQQMDVAEKNGFYRYRLSPEQKLNLLEWESKNDKSISDDLKKLLMEHSQMIIDTNDEDNNESTKSYAKEHELTVEDIREEISATLGKIVSNIFTSEDLGTLLVTGGDVLKECMDAMHVYEMEPVGEMMPGVVLSRFSKDGCTRYVISKSGGFGSANLIKDLMVLIKKTNQ